MVDTKQQLETIAKTKIYGEDSLTAGEAVALLVGVAFMLYGEKLPIPMVKGDKTIAQAIGVLILFFGFVVW